MCRTLSINKGPGVKYEEICIRKSRKVREGARGQWTRATMVEEVDINVWKELNKTKQTENQWQKPEVGRGRWLLATVGHWNVCESFLFVSATGVRSLSLEGFKRDVVSQGKARDIVSRGRKQSGWALAGCCSQFHGTEVCGEAAWGLHKNANNQKTSAGGWSFLPVSFFLLLFGSIYY